MNECLFNNFNIKIWDPLQSESRNRKIYSISPKFQLFSLFHLIFQQDKYQMVAGTKLYGHHSHSNQHSGKHL